MRTTSSTTACTTTCTACGTTAPTVPPPYTWSMNRDGASRSWTCVPCSRDHLPNIEGRDQGLLVRSAGGHLLVG